MSTPQDRKYAKTHEWVKIEGSVAIVGISDHAQDALGDITFVEVPKVGAQVKQGAEFGVVESVKAASDLYSPLSGQVSEVNTALDKRPELLNKDPYGDGWIMKVTGFNAAELSSLMDATAYETFLETDK